MMEIDMGKFSTLKARIGQSAAARGLTAGAAGFSSFAASAAVTAPDVTANVTYIESLWGPIALVAGAFLTIHYGIRGYKMLKRV